MQKWEYMVRLATIKTPLDSSVLNSFGDDGWELISITVGATNDQELMYVFKRPLKRPH